MNSRTARLDPEATERLLAEAPMSDALRGLARRGEVRRYRKGTILIEEGDRGETIWLILAGRVRVYSVAGNGRELTYGVYGPGEYLGEMSLDGGVRSASVETLETVTCAVIGPGTLRAYVDECPSFAFELLAKVIRRARAATLSAKHLALNDVYGRLKLLLESMGRPLPPHADGHVDAPVAAERVIDERLTHQDLANRLGCSREMVSRVMKDLESGGWLRLEGGRLVVKAVLPARW